MIVDEHKLSLNKLMLTTMLKNNEYLNYEDQNQAELGKEAIID